MTFARLPSIGIHDHGQVASSGVGLDLSAQSSTIGMSTAIGSPCQRHAVYYIGSGGGDL